MISFFFTLYHLLRCCVVLLWELLGESPVLTILQGVLNRRLGFFFVCFLCVLVVMELMIGDCMVKLFYM